ncbi:methylamine utilization protein [Pseudomonas tohonis]|uniref:methylamine utilization protein n=1 Tax=Pseudomonas tohonis TaxID=2725477 RepID=UPI0021D9B839|nr:methylamine utilization protein [Pseudomonas tohonis]UXY51468.1 methylamine utilization protein [Pseudomonas tohonis]
MPRVTPWAPGVGLIGLLCCLVGTLSAATLQGEVVDGHGQPLGNAVLSLKGPAGSAAIADTGVMDQRDKQFAPYVLAVHTGTAVSFPNSDNIRHHVYSFSPAKRFELRLYQGTPAAPVVFDKPGVVVLGCNIHDWMLGYVYITDDPFFAVSDDTGRLALDLPPGRYTASLWHPQVAGMLPVAAGEVEVPAAGLVQRFPLTLQGAPAVQPRVPEEKGFGAAFKRATGEAQ